jgi:antitoxin MazE
MHTQTKINMWGNSLAIRITSAMAKSAQLQKGSQVSIEANEDGITIKPLSKKRCLLFSEAELLTDLATNNSGTELLPHHLKNELDY